MISSEFLSGRWIVHRDYQDILTLAPSVTDTSNSGNPNIHGARDTDVVGLRDNDVVTLVDGAGTAEPSLDEDNISPQSLEEIEVITSGASAEFAPARCGFVKVVKNGKAIAGAKPAIRQAFPMICRLSSPRKSYHIGEDIVLYVAIKNITAKTVKIPASLSVLDVATLFRILDDKGNPVSTQPPSPTSLVKKTRPGKRRELQPGEWIVFKLKLNDDGGYLLDQPGLYRLVFHGSQLGVPDSIELTLRIEPSTGQ
jgi:hypothetical protein